MNTKRKKRKKTELWNGKWLTGILWTHVSSTPSLTGIDETKTKGSSEPISVTKNLHLLAGGIHVTE